MDLAILRNEALKLSSYERAQLADELIFSLSEDFSSEILKEWVNESEERYLAYRNGKIQSSDGPDIMRDLRTKFTL